MVNISHCFYFTQKKTHILFVLIFNNLLSVYENSNCNQLKNTFRVKKNPHRYAFVNCKLSLTHSNPENFLEGMMKKILQHEIPNFNLICKELTKTLHLKYLTWCQHCFIILKTILPQNALLRGFFLVPCTFKTTSKIIN